MNDRSIFRADSKPVRPCCFQVFQKVASKAGVDHPPPAGNLLSPNRLWRLKLELVALRAVVRRLGMLMVTEVAIQIRTIMRRSMRIGRFDARRFFRQFCRAAMTGHALLHGNLFRFFGLPMAFFTIHARQLMNVAPGQFAGQTEVILFMAGLAGCEIHGFGIRMLVGQHFFLNMARGAVPGLCFGRLQFRRGPERLTKDKRHHDAE